jgi:hypothetical protein
VICLGYLKSPNNRFSSSLRRSLEVGGRTAAAGSSGGRIRFSGLVGDKKSMTVCECLEEVGGGGGELSVKGFGGIEGESQLGDWAASFDCSDMALALGFDWISPLSSIIAAETEAVGRPPKKNVRTSIFVLPRAKARMPSKRLGNMGVALQWAGGEGGHSFVGLETFEAREEKAQSAGAHRGACGGEGVPEVSSAIGSVRPP